jgi:hypothetical protein
LRLAQVTELKAAEGCDTKKSEDVNEIACAPSSRPRICLVADDDAQGTQAVIMTKGKLVAGDFIQLVHSAFDNQPMELDAEGVAYADG